jgi:NodT family efflux transporter outer membrane factor (OMF) lipoprotein
MSGALARWLAASLLLTAGCVSAPAHKAPDVGPDIPESWQQEESRPAAAPPQGAWWLTFQNDRLNHIVQDTLVANHDLRAAVARVEQAAAAARIVSADLKPVVGAGLSAGRQRQNFVGFPIPGQERKILTTTATRFGLSVDVAWEVDLWGRLRADARAALADYVAAAEDMEAARQSLAAQAARAWFTVVEAREQVQLAEQTVVSRQESVAQVRKRYELGLRPSLDLRLAESTLSDARSLVARRRSLLDGGVRQLEILMGRYPAGRLLDGSEDVTLPPAAPSIPAGLPTDLLERRPDLRAAAGRFTASQQRLLAARRALYPRLTLTGSGGTVSDQLKDLVNGDFTVWSLLGGLTQPLFQGGRLRAGVDRAGAGRDETMERYAGTLLRAFAEVEMALADEGRLREQEEALTRSTAELAAALRLARDRYAGGVGDYLTVLESQSREFVARSALLAVRRERLTNRVDLFLALGGGFGDHS